ncbi:aminotransferase class V-fold PLP-dependent enzyme [Thiotrichales bacterium 19S11-10]|nr:aminotransferase class V-fold PLP-dependent enzyme [Thiotrichales bacterium 19S11-10]
MIYLDYASTTPVDPKVKEKMLACLTLDGTFGNPASNTHYYGYQAKELVDQATLSVANLIHADPKEIIWTSGATESNNLAIKGALSVLKKKGKTHIITSEIEHKAVLDPCHFLEEEGIDVTYLKPDGNGCIHLEQVIEAVTDKTALVSLMYVNNELGSINPVEEIGKFCRSQKILFHVDAAQAGARLPIDVVKQHIDLLSLSAHKLYGPKGIGILYVRRKPKVRLVPLIHGGGHQSGFRSGTLPTHQIVGMGYAAELVLKHQKEENKRIQYLKDRFLSEILKIPKVSLNAEDTVDGIMSLCFEGVDGEALMMALNKLALSAGSACNSATIEPSYVLLALGLTQQQAHSSLRISFGRFTTEEEVNQAIDIIKQEVEKLRNLSPFWQCESK